MIIGFTGSQTDMTDEQRLKFYTLLMLESPIELHHGDCIGADRDAHFICENTIIKIIIHPPIKSGKRAFCIDAHKILEPKEYLKRNHDIVDVCNLLIACPSTANKVTRSGTWATIRYARKTKTNYIVLNPNGEFSQVKF